MGSYAPEFLSKAIEVSAIPVTYVSLTFPQSYLTSALVNQLAVITLLSQYDPTIPEWLESLI